jgi:hypothetical protein
MEEGMKMTLRTMAMATAAFASVALLSPGWSQQGGVSLSVGKAEAYARLYVSRGYAARAIYTPSANLSWYAVRATTLVALEWDWVQLHRMG